MREGAGISDRPVKKETWGRFMQGARRRPWEFQDSNKKVDWADPFTVKNILQIMKPGKTPGLDGIPLEAWIY
ncbi:hypothetical protein JTB14_019303 [Gonioctena quinquepunctata]|nr:hypothetical protein JTB14_019303 [Gonioctena quinquepunctata]